VTRVLIILLGCAAVACDGESPFATPQAPCESRTAWWPDEDGDGEAEPGEVLISCEDPGDGWVDEPPPDTDEGE